MNTSVTGYLATGKVPGRRGTENVSLAPYKMYAAADGHVMIAAGNNNLFRRLAAALGHAEWSDDPRFTGNPERVRHRDALNGLIEDVVATRPCTHWIELLDRAGVPCAPLQNLDQVLAHPQTRALGMIQPTPDGAMQLLALPLSFDGARPAMQSGPVVLGADTAMVLAPVKAER
jgi:crotonobetainyl-CoA:carnitine CoA-transferase CaiB-like acyl-CoA transferase